MGYELLSNIRYYLSEIFSRPLRVLLVRLFGTSDWHIASVYNKSYSRDIINYINNINPVVKNVVEFGCGACDILRQINCENRIGYDNDGGVLRVASVLNYIYRENIALGLYDMVFDEVKNMSEFDVVIAINWTHEIEELILADRMSRIFASMKKRGVIIIDTVHGEGYMYNNNIDKLFYNCSANIEIIYSDDIRNVYAVVKL